MGLGGLFFIGVTLTIIILYIAYSIGSKDMKETKDDE
jgi:hypothetical protein|tara:strand:- start:2091 stop:2201 length:111 start_codon:yes stop_codon:yes gene_type:complete